ncbi:MAG TPA: PQQ-binding-like beta-propeller repeat protein [Acidimicrobiales bacterium]|nr:PQQ-binding-like beta-propeller repeat protein [Acidimicrobiales bacterium]
MGTAGGSTSAPGTGRGGSRRRGGGHRWGTVAAALAALVAGVVACGGGDDGPGSGDASAAARPTAEWVRLGYDLANTRAAVGETVIGPGTVADLRPAWELDGVKGVTGTPVVAGGEVYVGDWTGHLRALDAGTGDERWAHDLGGGYVGGAVALDDDVVVVGTFDARLVAVDRATGEPVWEVSVDDHPKAVVFGSPVLVDGLVVVGVGSFEVFAPGDPPTFRGQVVAVDAATGDEAWRFTVTAGDETEGPGVSVWSSPAVDTDRGVLYIGTGQAYAPPAPPRSDALLALDLRTGREVWSTQFTAGDAWTIADPTGLDADVGAAPNLFTAGGTDAVGVGDKAGTYRALDRDTGEVLWEHRITEGGLQGGVMASAAVAGGTVFVTSNEASRDAVLAALDADTGDELWRVDVGAHVTGPVTWANDVLYVADDSGRIAAYDADGGGRLWSHAVPFPAAGGIAVVDGTVYAGWGWWLASEPDDADGGLIAFRVGGGDEGGEAGEAGAAGPEGDDQAAGGPTGGGDGDDGTGREVYQRSCASCHGSDGAGASGPSLLGVDERLTRAEQVDVVREGRRGMPGWEGALTDEQIEAVVDHTRTALRAGG